MQLVLDEEVIAVDARALHGAAGDLRKIDEAERLAAENFVALHVAGCAGGVLVGTLANPRLAVLRRLRVRPETGDRRIDPALRGAVLRRARLHDAPRPRVAALVAAAGMARRAAPHLRPERDADRAPA